ncbi:Trk potassium uptake system protein TrkA [hydrothermal vent metagenome]|uniref:Trk potassium uptake system protein TrkA n=1 Tax=hydrothermal vent metagenome TaxID=652676 RepID=A0A3B0XCN6_9ZZZZ
MKILILGAGQVGSSVASHLASEANDITLVDHRADVLSELRDRMDIQTVIGNAAHPDILEQAGIEDTDMLIAVTNTDEVNMVACQVAWTLYHTPTKIARIRSTQYLKHSEIFRGHGVPVDVIISPEEIVTNYIFNIIEYPGALQVLDFADGKVVLVGLRAYYGGPLVGHQLRDLPEHTPGTDTRVAAIYRRGRAIIPMGNTVIEAGDEIFFIAAREDIRVVIRELRKLDKRNKRIIIAGGGNIGKRLAERLEKRHQVKIVECNVERAQHLSQSLNKCVVLLGDSADEELLLEENIDSMDVFCSVTNDDEANILAAMLAKRLGARKTMSLINRPAYVDLMENQEAIDVAISPEQVTIGALLTHVRRGDIVAVHSLRRGAAEAIEVIAHGDSKTSKVVGHMLEEIDLPEGTTIGAIVRGDEVIIAHHDTAIEAEDHVVLFLVDKKKIHDVERLFQVSVTFI